ncbi:MAG TPA: amidase [Burkholderiales bacterium]|jgi:aspartyl-tRNA(Asn)/glutamyl-tRNA(Gln) amidotransferase subunit A|nr:amidase [Burkholderiales bacterium]
MSRLTPEFLRALAAFRRYEYPERQDAWHERFALGLADIEQVFEAAVAGEPALRLPPAPQVESHAPGRYQAAESTTDLFSASAVQVAGRVRHRAQSPLEIARLFLDRIEAHRGLNAFITVDRDRVMQEAEGLEKRLRRGEDLGPLAGVPVGVKDLMPVRGHPMTAGTRAIEARVQDHDAPVVARLRAAGALIVGTTNLHELAFGVNSANPHFGHVRNPRYPDRIPGGSSGGSAAAVAAGLAAIAVGSCTGGSIRMPAACCGIVGFKPTYDAVPRDEVHPLAWSLDHIGPLTRTVEDAALAFEVMAGLPEHSTLPAGDAMPPRLVRPANFFYDLLDPEVRAALDRAFERLREAGAVIGQAPVPGIELAPGIQQITMNSEAAQANQDLLRKAGDRMGEDVRVRLEIGLFYLATDYVKAQQLRARVRASMIEAMGGADAMVVPATAILPPKLGATQVEIDGRPMHITPAMTRYTSPINFCGFPALSLPCGRSAAGLPVNMQVVGRPGADAAVLRVARWCERILAA